MKKMRRLMIGLVGALVMSSLFVLGQAIPSQAEVKLVESPPAALANFGSSVSSSGNMVVVGVPGHEGYKGAAYVYRLNGTVWELAAELTAGDGAEYDFFGQAVSISANTVVVGAPNNSATVNSVTIPYSGAAYVFKNNGSLWELSAKLTASDAATSDGFGVSVSTSGNTIVVGSPGQGDMDSGAAYVYALNGTRWEQIAKLPQAPVDFSNFGQSVSISGDMIVVGAPFDTAHDGTSYAGAAYVFKHDSTGWVQMEKLTASTGDAAMWDGFGFSVSVSGNTVAIGAPWAEGITGAAYVFALNGTLWQQMAKFPLEGVGSYSYFGQSVAVSGDTIVVGAYNDDVTDGPTNTGAAYLFRAEGTEWIVEKVTASDAVGGDGFGFSVSISGDTVIVGAPWEEDGSSEVSQVMSAGAAYVFTLEGESTELFVDIRPGFCVNPLNPKSQGVLPVAILGTEDFDVKTIDPRSIRLSREGADGEVAPIRGHYGDVGKPNQCEPESPTCYDSLRDGYKDLILMFKTQELVKALELWDVAGETITLTLAANLKEEFGGTAVSGQDDVKVLGKKPKPKPPKKPKK